MDSQEETIPTSSVFSFEELKKLTNEKKDEKKIKFEDRIKIGRDDAIKHITQGCYDKMKMSASKGYDTSIIYTFSWVSDPDAKVDNNGNKTVFEGNIRLLDLVNKDRINFIDSLNKYFNNDGEDKFHCYIKKNILKGESVWYINVSWGEKIHNEHKFIAEENQYQSSFKNKTKDAKGNKSKYRKEPKCNEGSSLFSGVYKGKYVPKKNNLI